MLREAFHKSKFFSVMANSFYINEIYQNTKILLLQDNTKVSFEEPGDNILNKKENNENNNNNDNKILYCIISGNFIIKEHINNNTIKMVGKRGELFGEEFLNIKSKMINSKNDIFTEGECRIFKIVQRHFKNNAYQCKML